MTAHRPGDMRSISAAGRTVVMRCRETRAGVDKKLILYMW